MSELQQLEVLKCYPYIAEDLEVPDSNHCVLRIEWDRVILKHDQVNKLTFTFKQKSLQKELKDLGVEYSHQKTPEKHCLEIKYNLGKPDTLRKLNPVFSAVKGHAIHLVVRLYQKPMCNAPRYMKVDMSEFKDYIFGKSQLSVNPFFPDRLYSSPWI